MDEDMSRIKSIIHEQRLMLSKARRMTEDENDDNFYSLIIEYLDELLYKIGDDSKEFSVWIGLEDGCGYLEVAPLVFPCSREVQILLCCVNEKLKNFLCLI
ncbi:hypothetical protein [Paraburkholderia sacchari]|uniref:Uncharacterized protein n=1 Tax=Paraburkholderia sacchari TaxID=159450 RepID=A0A8T6ZCS2_9BURK|nr:hypothetical protein [Paraburkholderia sacchari]NLP62090.1 hypothetical protein [Paraburkholderia sacchari]